MNDAVIITDYDPEWPQQFERLRSRIAAALGSMAVSIEHIGSTAVPGLAAKPIIDIDGLLRSKKDLPLVIQALTEIGYTHRGDLGIPGREAFGAPSEQFPHHLYVCLPGSPEYARHLAFRNHLRTHPSDARAYTELKKRLAAEFGSNREGYNQAKTEFVENILRCVEPTRTSAFILL